MTDPTDVIRLYLDDDKEPFKTARPPLRFQFSTLALADGPHRLRVEAHNGLAGDSIKEIPFHVRNGVAITVSGINPQQEIAGQVGLVINAYAGNTEIDFEPSRAETPQPIPAWAWLIFLGIVSWTMFYILNPQTKRASAMSPRVSEAVGERVYTDVCAKCHQESGEGAPGMGPAKLKDANIVISADPSDLVSWVAGGPVPEGAISAEGGVGSGRSRVKMLAFGPPRLRPLEFVSTLNYIRMSWGNQAPPIEPVAQRAPEDIRKFDEEYVKALQAQDFVALEKMYTAYRSARLVRRHIDDVYVDASDAPVIRGKLEKWMLNVAEVNSIEFQQAAYAVMEGGVVYAHGRVVQTLTMKGSPARTVEGDFIRVYVKEQRLDPTGKPICGPNNEPPPKEYRLVFDYATTPMPIGCLPNHEGEECPPDVDAGKIDYEEIQKILSAPNQKASTAPHGNFWDLPYKEFVEKEFDYKPIKGGRIRLINYDKAKGIVGSETNLVKALRDGKDVFVDVYEDGKYVRTVHQDIPRMPKNAKPIEPPDRARIAAWIDHGWPEKVVAPTETAGPKNPETPTSPTNPTNPTNPPANGGDWRADDLDFAGLKALLASLKLKASGAPHGPFWQKDYDDFVKLEFEIESGGPKAKLIEPGKPERSNLLRMLEGEHTLIVRKPDGTEDEHYDIGRGMPPAGKGTKPTKEQVELIRRWIAHGAPKDKPAGAGGTPPEPPVGPTTPAAMEDKPPTPPTSPVPADEKKPPTPDSSTPPANPPTASASPAMAESAPAAMDGTPAASGDAMLDYPGVQALIASWKPKVGSSPHGKFWELPYEKFLTFEFPVYAENAKARLVVPGDAEKSNLVRALERRPLVIVGDDGKEREWDPEKSMPPAGKGQKPKPEEIARIKKWISAGCPK